MKLLMWVLFFSIIPNFSTANEITVIEALRKMKSLPCEAGERTEEIFSVAIKKNSGIISVAIKGNIAQGILQGAVHKTYNAISDKNDFLFIDEVLAPDEDGEESVIGYNIKVSMCKLNLEIKNSAGFDIYNFDKEHPPISLNFVNKLLFSDKEICGVGTIKSKVLAQVGSYHQQNAAKIATEIEFHPLGEILKKDCSSENVRLNLYKVTPEISEQSKESL